VAWAELADGVLPWLLPAERVTLARRARVLHLAGGAHLFQAGEQPDALYLLLSGAACCYRPSVAGREVWERVAGPGDLVCPLATVDRRPAPASARALRPAEVLAIPADLAWESVTAATSLGRAIVRELCDCCRRLSGQLTLLSLDGADQRVAWVLSELSRQVDRGMEAHVVRPDGPRNGAAVVEITHADLAALLGTSREVVSRSLSRLRRAGLVETGRCRIRVPDLAALHRRAGR